MEARVKTAFKGQDVQIQSHVGNPIEFAEDVKIYQYAEHRLTAASVMVYPSGDGRRQLQHNPTALKAKTLRCFEKMNSWARLVDGISCFISYKDITENFSEPLSDFDVVTHFDKIAGLNLDGLVFLVVYGYPKVKHEVVISQALTQFASDTTPIPTGSYEDLTQTQLWEEDQYSIYEARYTDARLDAIRIQLSVDKLQQAIGRARHVRWKGTTTIIFTNTPVPTITERATLFTEKAFLNASHLRDIEAAGERIETAKADGDAKAYQQATGYSRRSTFYHTAEANKQNRSDVEMQVLDLRSQEKSIREISTLLGISKGRVEGILKRNNKVS